MLDRWPTFNILRTSVIRRTGVRVSTRSELLPRVELGTSSLPRMRSTTELKQHFLLLRRGRSLLSGKRDSNPRPPAWKASALSTELFPQIGYAPSNPICGSLCIVELRKRAFTLLAKDFRVVWVRMDSNHRSRRQQIYSLPHLATLEHTHFQRSPWEPLVGLEPTTAGLQI